MLKIRFKPTIGILLCVAGFLVFCVFGWLALKEDTWDFVVLAIAAVNVLVGYLSFITPHIVLEPNGVVVKNRFAQTVAKYPIDKQSWVQLDDDFLYIIKRGGKTQISGITRSNCNANDWDSFREIVAKSPLAKKLAIPQNPVPMQDTSEEEE